tara:strand:+ start:259 stop:510 length:252 start_codon:yes stop_codon:yes gene_type:complete
LVNNPNFFLKNDFIEDKVVNNLLNEYEKIFKNAYELLPINVDMESRIILSQYKDILEDAIAKNKKLSTDNILEMLNTVEGRIY